jgi:hypothetical protein
LVDYAQKMKKAIFEPQGKNDEIDPNSTKILQKLNSVVPLMNLAEMYQKEQNLGG